jgi:Arc/MetJ family transcription regulator
MVKAIKEACHYGLKEAKDIVDSTLPASVIRGISKERAEEIKQEIESAGGKAKINSREKTATKKVNSSTDSVMAAPAAAPATPTSSAPKAITLEDIYGGPQYYCVLAGQSFGPVTIRQFANMVRFGIVDKNTMVWKNGMSNWAIAQTVADLQVVL